MRFSSKHRLCVVGGLVLGFLLFGSAHTLFAQQRPAIDSLRWRLETVETDIARVRTLHALAREYLHFRPDSTVGYAKKALALAQGTGETGEMKKEAARSLRIMGVAHRLQGNLDQAVNYLARAREAFEAAGDKRGAARVLGNLGNVHQSQGGFSRALSYYLRALKAFEELGDEEGIADGLNNLGIAHTRQDNVKQALTYFRRAARSYRQLGKRAALAGVYTNMGLLLKKRRAYDESVRYCRRALQIFEREDSDQFGVAVASGNIGVALNRGGNHREALPHLFRAVRVSKALGAKRQLGAAYDEIGRAYRETGKLDSALVFARKGVAVAEAMGAMRLLRESARTLSAVYAARESYEKAYRYHRRYSAANDSMFSEEKEKVIARMQSRYETEKKEQQIDSLQQAGYIQALEMQRQQRTRNALGGGLALVLLLAGVLYNRYRLKEKALRLVKVQKEEISQKREALQASLTEKKLLVKEIHHRVKNNLQVVASLLNLQMRRLDDPHMQAAVRDVRSRVKAMALIHKRLYRVEDLYRVDAQDYVEELCGYLLRAFDGEAESVRCETNVENFSLDVDTAVPLGLIINELLSNALKHAFPERKGGKVILALRKTKEDSYELVVADDGVGLPADARTGFTPELGMSLVEDWTRQLGGALQITGEKGVTYTIRFNKG